MKDTAKRRDGSQGGSFEQLVFAAMADARSTLHGAVVQAGMTVLSAMLEEDRAKLCGARYVHDPARSATRAGYADGELAMGGRRVTIRRPRVRGSKDREVRRLAMPRRGFFVIVPLEHSISGAPPASWFIDELMKFHGAPYYVGLLSAALHGAAHQQPQEFEVVTNLQLRPTAAGRVRLRFFKKKTTSSTPAIDNIAQALREHGSAHTL